MKKAVFLDRDGVLNKTIFRFGKPRAPYTLEEFELLPGVKEGTEILLKHGFLLIVVTNQPDVARGWVSRDAVDEVNKKLRELLQVHDLKACFHTDDDNCNCRKPQPGMLVEAAREWSVDLKKSFMVGDRISDVEAGKAAGCRTILIDDESEKDSLLPDYRASGLLEASQLIVTFI
ncbi:MAG: D-glycero-alpha-D-manno-heptose-1,7-bisphosphate 7-phosphatase [Bacteriovoracia bacterium]